MEKPILANFTEYVKYIIEDAKCGIVIDFNETENLIKTVDKLTENKMLRNKLSMNAGIYHRNIFNWENHSKKFYKKLEDIC